MTTGKPLIRIHLLNIIKVQFMDLVHFNLLICKIPNMELLAGLDKSAELHSIKNLAIIDQGAYKQLTVS